MSQNVKVSHIVEVEEEEEHCTLLVVLHEIWDVGNIGNRVGIVEIYCHKLTFIVMKWHSQAKTFYGYFRQACRTVPLWFSAILLHIFGTGTQPPFHSTDNGLRSSG